MINIQQASFDGVDNKLFKPLIKWAGGKTRLNAQLLKVSDVAMKSLNVNKLNYFEPFLGVEHYFLSSIKIKIFIWVI